MRKALFPFLLLFALISWVSTAHANDGREPGDPRQVCHMGSYSGIYIGPWTAASGMFPNGSGVVICGPDSTDDGTVGQFMNLPPAAVPVALVVPTVVELAKVVAEDLGKINFAFDSDEVEAQYYELLSKVAGILLANPSIQVSLSGHTDRVGTDAYNQDLGMRRSVAIQTELVLRSVPMDQLGLTSFGEAQPLIDVFTPERENRRVEVRTLVE